MLDISHSASMRLKNSLNENASFSSYNPSISIITVCYNDLSNLQTTLDNLRSLPHGSNMEFIVIDGGSQDGTSDYLQTLDDARLRWVSEHDKGLYDAMNKGIERATKEWLWFINAGDKIDASLMISIRSETNDKKENTLIYVPVLDNGRLVSKKIPQWQIPYCHQGVLFKNDTTIKYDTTYRIGADYKYILQYIKKYNLDVRCIPIISSSGAVVAELNGISRQNRVARDWEAFRISLEHFGLCRNILFFPPLLIYQSLRIILNRIIR